MVEPEIVEQGVGRIVEGQHVIGHVHVTVVVDPLRADDVAIKLERRGYFHGRKTAARTTIWQDGLPPLTARRRGSAPASVRPVRAGRPCAGRIPRPGRGRSGRSEEPTSKLQSLLPISYAACC